MHIYFVIIAFIVFIAFIQFHKSNKKEELKIYRKYKRVVSKYKERFTYDFSNEIVYQFIAEIDKLPVIKKKQDIIVGFEDIYANIKNNKLISEDLKLQLRVTLKLKGIKIYENDKD